MKNKKLTTFLANMGIIIVSETAMAAEEFRENDVDSIKKGISVTLTDENKIDLKKKKIFEELQVCFNKNNYKNTNAHFNNSCITNSSCYD